MHGTRAATTTRSGALAGAARNIKQIPVMFHVQATGLTLAVLATLLVGVLETQRTQAKQYETVAFAVPVNPQQQTWGTEVDAFAQRMQLVFGLHADVAAEFSGWILEASRRQHLQPELIASLVFTESSFRKDAVSHVGALGPAQIRPYWKSFCGSKMLRDPAENIFCGAQILAYFKDACGDERCALLSYNLGPYGMRQEQFASAGNRYVNRIDSHRERFDLLENAAL
jgi:soluble lytic murein transglycosylase-like protein